MGPRVVEQENGRHSCALCSTNANELIKQTVTKALGGDVAIIVLFSRDCNQHAYHSIALEKLYQNAFGSDWIRRNVEPQTEEN
jgi:hypothetical protein